MTQLVEIVLAIITGIVLGLGAIVAFASGFIVADKIWDRWGEND